MQVFTPVVCAAIAATAALQSAEVAPPAPPVPTRAFGASALHDEAGEVLGCPSGTIAWRVHEARRKLRLYLEERGFGGDLE